MGQYTAGGRFITFKGPSAALLQRDTFRLLKMAAGGLSQNASIGGPKY